MRFAEKTYLVKYKKRGRSAIVENFAVVIDCIKVQGVENRVFA